MKILNESDLEKIFGNYQSVVDSFIPNALKNNLNSTPKHDFSKVAKAPPIEEFDVSKYEGKTFYMVPWSLFLDQETNSYFINMGHTIHKSLFGTANMKVTVTDGVAEVWFYKSYNLIDGYNIYSKSNSIHILPDDINRFKEVILVSKINY